MSEPKLTPWFVNGEKPVHAGVYNVSCRTVKQSGDWYLAFNGEKWSDWWALNHLRALSEAEHCGSLEPASWRGLAEKPE